MIGCLFGIVAFFLPRLVIVLLLVFSTFVTRPFAGLMTPFNGLLLPILGCVFLPYTLLAYCLAVNQHGSVGGMWVVLVVAALLMDLGLIGGGAKNRKKIIVKKVKQ